MAGLIYLSACSVKTDNNQNQSDIPQEKPKKVSVKIKPHKETDRGKFWKICINYSKGSFDKPVAYFEIEDINNFKREYQIDFIHLKERCNEKNVLVSFVGRHTPHEEWEWLKALEADSVKQLKVRVKDNWDDENYVITETFIGEELK